MFQATSNGPRPRTATATARPRTTSHDSHQAPSRQPETSSSPPSAALTAASMRVHQRKNTVDCSSSRAAVKSARAAGGKNSETISAIPSSGRIGSTSTPTGWPADNATANQPPLCERLNSISSPAKCSFPPGFRRIGTAAGGQPSAALSNSRSCIRVARNSLRCGRDRILAARLRSSSESVATRSAVTVSLANFTRYTETRVGECECAGGRGSFCRFIRPAVPRCQARAQVERL